MIEFFKKYLELILMFTAVVGVIMFVAILLVVFCYCIARVPEEMGGVIRCLLI